MPVNLLLSTLFLFVLGGQSATTTTQKRGLCYTQAVPANGQQIWYRNSDLTWYYNYGSTPLDFFDKSDLEFVPMLWGAGSQYAGFLETVTGLIKKGVYINHVLGFNEPDLCTGGGSCVSASKAAQIWKQEIQPLKKVNSSIHLGAPAVSNVGLGWLHDFMTACDGCTFDFIPLHWYGTYDAFVDYLNTVRAKYPGKRFWVTEFGLPNASVAEAQQFYKQSVAHLDNAGNITHYSYYGSFRSSDASPWLGGNGAMLNGAGKLTDIGDWYLGRPSSGVNP